jgi:hypothetical protein
VYVLMGVLLILGGLGVRLPGCAARPGPSLRQHRGPDARSTQMTRKVSRRVPRPASIGATSVFRSF